MNNTKTTRRIGVKAGKYNPTRKGYEKQRKESEHDWETALGYD